MRRREFIVGAGAWSAFSPGARAQNTRVPVVGVLYAGGEQIPDYLLERLRKGLGGMALIEGRDFVLKTRASAAYGRMPEFAGEFVRDGVAVILATGASAAAQAAKTATSSIPIVFANGGDPVELGLVASLSRPGGNLTGVSYLAGQLEPKRLELLREIAPGAGAIVYLVNPANPRSAGDTRVLNVEAERVGQRLVVRAAMNAGEIDAAFVAAAGMGAHALIVAGDSFFNDQSTHLAALGLRHALPTSYSTRRGPEAGGLMSYSDDRRGTQYQAGLYVARVLKGEKPANLPVLQPMTYEFVINLKTARALGLTVPQTLLVFANEVIE